MPSLRDFDQFYINKILFSDETSSTKSLLSKQPLRTRSIKKYCWKDLCPIKKPILGGIDFSGGNPFCQECFFTVETLLFKSVLSLQHALRLKMTVCQEKKTRLRGEVFAYFDFSNSIFLNFH